MGSAYAPYTNAVIELYVDQGYTSDGYNEMPNLVKFRLAAHLKQIQTPTPFPLGGADQYLTNYTGYLIDPPPSGYVRPQEVTVNFTELGVSKFIMVRLQPSPFYDELRTLGTPIALLSRVA